MDILILFSAITLLLSTLVVHEMGHWALLKRFQVSTTEIGFGLGPLLFKVKGFGVRLFPIGAYVVPEQHVYEALPHNKKLWIILGGPAANALYAAALTPLVILYADDPGLEKFFTMLVGLNLLLAQANLLPIPPLDGWKAFEVIAEHLKHPLSDRTKGVAARVGNGLIYGLGGWVIGYWLLVY